MIFPLNQIGALLILSVLCSLYSFTSTANEKLFSKEIVFWMNNQETFHLPASGNFVIALNVLNGEDLNINAFATLKAELAQLDPKPNAESLHIRSHEIGDFTIQVEGCTKACLDKIVSAAEALKIRSIAVADYSPEDLIGQRNYFSALEKAILQGNGANLSPVLRDSPYAHYLALPERDVHALELTFSTPDGFQVVDEGYLRELIQFVNDKSLTLMTMKLGAYSRLGRSSTISEIARAADLSERTRMPTPKSGTVLLKGDEDHDYKITATQYIRFPSN